MQTVTADATISMNAENVKIGKVLDINLFYFYFIE